MMTDKKATEDWIGALTEFENAELNKVNPHFKSKYGDLVAVRKATNPTLKKYRLGIAQRTEIRDGEFMLVSRMVHASGEILDEAIWPLSRGKAQQMGSELTYGRRYTWATLCGIASEEDDDGNAAQKISETAKKDKKQQQQNNDDALKARLKTAWDRVKGWSGSSDGFSDYVTSPDFLALESDLKTMLPNAWNGADGKPGLSALIDDKMKELEAREFAASGKSDDTFPGDL